ncbi:TetR/AcrR family transcriptional regulator [Microbacterium arabinogalactanolyticum]|uniref:TetR/AcrR family transcriptional regulator n=1 Tax=Microbacterium arabinogalactanolyticum TaxID=69365 RepID=UPI004044E0A0
MPRPRSEKARHAVLEAMLRALAADGYAAVTIEGLAAEAGVSKQTIYRWWPSKAAILGEALLEGSLPGFELPMTSDLRADLRAVLSARNPDAVALARALIEVTATDVELGLKLNARLAAPIREWTAVRLAQAVDAGDVRADVDAAVVADQLIAIGSYSALVGGSTDAGKVDGMVEVMLRGIGS